MRDRCWKRGDETRSSKVGIVQLKDVDVTSNSDLRPLQELLLRLLPVGVEERLRHQLHQLQAVFDFHQQLKVIPSSNLRAGETHQ